MAIKRNGSISSALRHKRHAPAFASASKDNASGEIAALQTGDPLKRNLRVVGQDNGDGAVRNGLRCQRFGDGMGAVTGQKHLIAVVEVRDQIITAILLLNIHSW